MGRVSIKENDWVGLRQQLQKLGNADLGPNSSPTFEGLTLTGLTASRIVQTTTGGELTIVSDLTSYVAGTAKRVTVANDGDGTITLSGPQDLDTVDSPTFAGMTLSGLTATRLVATNGSSVLSSTALNSWVAGTANQIVVTDDGDGTITLSGPQDLAAASSPTFGGLTLNGNCTIQDDAWIGAGAASNRVIFDTSGGYMTCKNMRVYQHSEGIAGDWGVQIGSATATHGMLLTCYRGRGTIATPSAVSDGDAIWALRGYGYQNSGWRAAALIESSVKGAPAGNYVPSNIIFKTSSDAAALAEAMRITPTGDVSIGGVASPTGKLHVDQASGTGAKPVAVLDQADVDQPFVQFIGTAAAATLTNSIVDVGDVGTATVAGYVKVNVQDDGNQIADQDYYLAIYTLAS